MSSGSRDGFSLLLVVWLVVLLSGLGLHWSATTRLQFATAINHVDRIETLAAAEWGLATARAILDRRLSSIPSPEELSIDPWRTTQPVVVRSDASADSDLGWSATIDDLGRRLNLNVVDAIQLRRFLEWFVHDARAAGRIADATLDWRDADAFTRAEGAEAEAYAAAGLPILPPNRPFDDVDEWRHVLGVSDELSERASGHLSVDGSGRINVRTAPLPVLASLPGFGTEAMTAARAGAAGSLTELFGALSPSGRTALEPHLGWLESRTTFTTDEMLIDVVGYRAGGGSSSRLTAVLARSGGASSLTVLRERR